MKPLLTSPFGSTFAMALTFLLLNATPQTLHANDDYEFAVSLLEVNKQSPSFHMEDLLERLVTRMKQSSAKAVQAEARLVEALLIQSRAGKASAARRTEMLGKAETLCDQFLRENARHPRRADARKLVSEIRTAFIRSLLAKNDDVEPSIEARNRAVVMVEGMLPERKAAADAAWSALNAIQLPDDPMAEYPPSLLRRLGRAIEKAVVTDQAWLTTWLLLIEACPSGERRGKEIKALTEVCQARVDHEKLMDCDLACALYMYLKGRGYSFQPDEPKATEAWREALRLLPENTMEAAVAKTVNSLMAALLLDYVRMKKKGADKDPERYERIVDMMRGAIRSPPWPEIAKLPTGKQLTVDFSLALARQPDSGSKDVAEAFHHLRQLAKGGPPWSNNAALAMAQVLTEAGPRKRPKLSATEWYETGRGCLMQGQRAYRDAQEKEADGNAQKAEEKRQEANQHFQHALQFYRRAISASRDPEQTDLLTRLNIEPNAWFETGLCHQRMKGLVEACVAYGALTGTFGPEGRQRWLPKRMDARTRNQVNALFAALDKQGSGGSEGLLQKAANNRRIAARRMNPHDRMRAGANDALTHYERGRLKMEEGRRLEVQAFAQHKAGRREDAVKNWTAALDVYCAAIAEFTREQQAAPTYELALYHAGYVRLLAQSVIVERLGRFGAMNPKAADEEARKLATEALQAFRDYEAHTSMSHQPSADVAERREKLAATIRQTRVHLLYNAKRYAECVADANACLKAEGVNPADTPRDPALAAVLFARYRALVRLASRQSPPACDPLLGSAERTVAQLKAHERYYRYALADLAARHHNTSARITADGGDPKAVVKYDRQTARYLWQSLQGRPEAERTMGDYYRVLGAVNKTEDWPRLVEVAVEMLERFDPKKKGLCIEDTQWPAILRRMHQCIQYADLRKREQCMRDHTVLVDYMYEDFRNESRSQENRPDEDRFPVDLEKARLQIQTIRANYPGCGTLNPKQGLNGVSWVQVVSDEVEFRQRVLTTRDALANAAIVSAESARSDQAAQYRDIAREQLEILLAHWGNIPSVKLKIADLAIANEKYEAAVKTLGEVKRDENGNPDPDMYIRTSVRISRVYKLQGDAKSAVIYPQFMLNAGGPWQRYFPDIHEFLEWCYQNGAPRPKAAEVATKNLDYGMKTADEVEFKEEVEPAYRKSAREDLPANVRWAYDFLKRKIEQAKELAELDRFIQSKRGEDQENDRLQTARSRFQLLRKLGEQKTKLWKLRKKIDIAIVSSGTVARMKQEHPELLPKRDELTRTIADLEAELAKLPEVDTTVSNTKENATP